MKIIGAGLSGLLAAQYFRSRSPVVLEKQESLPNNHHALLRFRSSAVSDLTGIRFKKVRVHKMINYKGEHFTRPNLHLNNMYSVKCTGSYRGRSLMNLDSVDRYIAPPDFINRASQGIEIKYGMYTPGDLELHEGGPIISTMPIQALADHLGYDFGKVEFQSRPIWTVNADIAADVELYQTVYYPNPDLSLYRLSITGRRVIAEFCEDPWEFTAMDLMHFLECDFGIRANITGIGTKHQHHGKLIESDRKEVQDFMSWASRAANVYSLGRWGTHRQILMDDVVQDLKVIDNLIESNQYRR